MKVNSVRRRHFLLEEIARHDRTLAEHRKLAGLHAGTDALGVCMRLADIAYNHREAARRELVALPS